MDSLKKPSNMLKTDEEKQLAASKSLVSLDKLSLDRSMLEKLEHRKREADAKKLRRKLQQVADKNETLAKTLQGKNEEIDMLKRSVESLNDVLNSVPIEDLRCNSSIAGTKILELCKKNRQLRAELEITKNRVSKREAEIHKLERELKQAEKSSQPDGDLPRKASHTSMDEMQSKLNAVQQKLFESRNKSTELQTQLKLAQKCLQQEVGDNFNINLLTSPEQSTWRGRAQQILHLQQTVHELRERLELCEPPQAASLDNLSIDSFDGVSLIASQMAKPSGERRSTRATFDRFSPGVRKSEIQHRAKVEAMQKEIGALQVQLEDQRAKVLAGKVRNKTLNEEIIKYKMRASSMVEQTDCNGINLASMEEKLVAQKQQFESRIEELGRLLRDVERQRDDANYKLDDLRSSMENHETQLAEKDTLIKQQTIELQKLQADVKALCGGFLFSCRELHKEEFISILEALEVEKNHLLEHAKTLEARIDQERKKNETVGGQLAKQKTRSSRMEAKIRELEKELELQTERKRRSQRIADYAQSLNGAASMSCSQSVSSLVFENASMMSGDSTNLLDDLTPAQALELRHQLVMAKEKNALLEDKIALLTEEKANDAKLFHNTIANSKSVILETIRTQRGNSTARTSCHTLDEFE